jgi:hypothetical protein
MLKCILFTERDGIATEVNRAAKWYGLETGGLTPSQEQRLRKVGRLARRSTACAKLMRNSDATLWFTDGSPPQIPRQMKKHPLLLLNRRHPLPAESVSGWLKAHDVKTLHVAGRRDLRPFILSYLPKLFRAAGRGLFLDSPGKFPAGTLAVLGADRVWAVTPWPQLRSYFRVTKPWQSRDGRLPMALKLIKEQSADPVVASFLQYIPAGIRDAFMNFQIGHRELIHFYGLFEREVTGLARGGAYMLLYVLSGWRTLRLFAGWDQDDMRELLSWRQRSIWATCGLPDTEAVARAMRKIPADCCSIPMFEAMRSVFPCNSPACNLTHLPRINLGAAQAAVHPLATPELIREVAGSDSEDQPPRYRFCPTARLLHDIAEEAGHRQAQRLLRPVRSAEDGRALMQRILNVPDPRVVALPAAAVWLESRIEADPPSIAGLIEQLSDEGSLRKEGENMRHCVANYAGRVEGRKSLIFRVLPGQFSELTRSTVELVGGIAPLRWQLGQIKGARNGPVTPQTLTLVRTWLQLANENPQIAAEELKEACLAATVRPALRVA